MGYLIPGVSVAWALERNLDFLADMQVGTVWNEYHWRIVQDMLEQFHEMKEELKETIDPYDYEKLYEKGF